VPCITFCHLDRNVSNPTPPHASLSLFATIPPLLRAVQRIDTVVIGAKLNAIRIFTLLIIQGRFYFLLRGIAFDKRGNHLRLLIDHIMPAVFDDLDGDALTPVRPQVLRQFREQAGE
jgi:hypothetical protein